MRGCRLSAIDILQQGLNNLATYQAVWAEEDNYLRGAHERPFAPAGVNKEYRALQEMAVAPWLRLVVKAPVQRLRVDGFRTDASSDADMSVWKRVWKANKLGSRQRMVYEDAVAHGRGVVEVAPPKEEGGNPRVGVVSPSQVWVEYQANNRFVPMWAVKTWEVAQPNGGSIQNATVYTDTTITHFLDTRGLNTVQSGGNSLGRVPFVEFRPEWDSLGRPLSMIRPLFPMQRAIDTMRFDLLLSAQFSAYRQRIVTGFDPVIYDDKGIPVFQTDKDGKVKTDAEGNPIPATVSPGRPGVDRLMAFPGADTKVFDLAESNLGNYVSTIKMLVQQLAAISQVPPQYLLGDMANLSGEALDAAESTLGALVDDLKREFSSSWEDVVHLADLAVGGEGVGLASEVIWGDAVAKSFGQVVDGITKLVQTGFPYEAAWEMLPGATQVKVQQWLDMAESERAMGNPYARALTEGLESTSGVA